MAFYTQDGDWVTYWKRRLSLAMVVDGSPKGRTITALKSRVAMLAGNPSTVDMSNRLKNYLGLVLMAEQLRPEAVMKVPRSELTTILTAMKEEKLELPLQIRSCLVEHRIAALLNNPTDPGLILRVLTPWPQSDGLEFDALNPDLGRLELALEAKVELFRRYFWRQLVAPMLMGDVSQHDRILTIVRATHDAFAKEDPVDLELAAATLVHESMQTCKGIEALLTMPPDPAYEKALLALKARSQKTDKSVLTCVASAVAANNVLSAKLDTLLRAMPVLHEYGEQVKRFEKTMDDGVASDSAGFLELTEMCMLVGKINSSSASALFTRFNKRVLNALTDAWSTTNGSAAPVAPDVLKSAQATFAEAAIVFSFNDTVAEMQVEIAGKLRTADSADRTDSLRKLLPDEPEENDFDAIGAADDLDKLKVALKGVQGITLDEDLKARVNANFLMMLAGAARASVSQSKQSIAKVAIDVLEMMTDAAKLKSWSGVPELLRAMTRVCELGVERTVADVQDLDGRTKDDAMLKDMHTFMASVKGLEAAMAKLAKVEQAEVKAVVEEGGKQVEESAALAGAFYKALVEKRVAAMAARVDEAISFIGDLPKDGKWHASITGDGDEAWVQVKALGTSITQKLNMVGFERVLKACKDDIKMCEDIVPLLIGTDDAKSARDKAFDDAKATRKTLLVMYCELQLIFHMSSDLSRADLRKRIQTEIRLIRSEKIEEKKVLHPLIFARAYATLQGGQ